MYLFSQFIIYYIINNRMCIVLERGWGLENDWDYSCSSLVGRIALQFPSQQAPSSLPLVPPLSLLVIPARMVPTEDTLTLKSDLVIDTRYAQYCIMTCLIIVICVIHNVMAGLSYYAIRKFESCLEIHYITLDCWLALLTLLKHN